MGVLFPLGLACTSSVFVLSAGSLRGLGDGVFSPFLGGFVVLSQVGLYSPSCFHKRLQCTTLGLLRALSWTPYSTTLMALMTFIV